VNSLPVLLFVLKFSSECAAKNTNDVDVLKTNCYGIVVGISDFHFSEEIDFTGMIVDIRPCVEVVELRRFLLEETLKFIKKFE
jgi:uncharacterized protein (DUF1015 family)